MNRENLLQLAVSGTVTFPAVLPRLAELQLQRVGDLPVALGPELETYVIATERPSPRITMKRSVLVSEVRAVFLPRDVNHVNFNDGTWLIRDEIETGLRTELLNRQRVYGIVYVAEQTPSLLEVHAGMTAAESAQYYPPLPVDRSVNHYDPYRQSDPSKIPASAIHRPCDTSPAPRPCLFGEGWSEIQHPCMLEEDLAWTQFDPESDPPIQSSRCY